MKFSISFVLEIRTFNLVLESKYLRLVILSDDLKTYFIIYYNFIVVNILIFIIDYLKIFLQNLLVKYLRLDQSSLGKTNTHLLNNDEQVIHGIMVHHGSYGQVDTIGKMMASYESYGQMRDNQSISRINIYFGFLSWVGDVDLIH